MEYTAVLQQIGEGEIVPPKLMSSSSTSLEAFGKNMSFGITPGLNLPSLAVGIQRAEKDHFVSSLSPGGGKVVMLTNGGLQTLYVQLTA